MPTRPVADDGAVELVELLVGSLLIAAWFLLNVYISREMFGLTVWERIQVTALPACCLVAFYGATLAAADLRWWTIPLSLFGVGVLQVASLRVFVWRDERKARPSP